MEMKIGQNEERRNLENEEIKKENCWEKSFVKKSTQ